MQKLSEKETWKNWATTGIRHPNRIPPPFEVGVEDVTRAQHFSSLAPTPVAGIVKENSWSRSPVFLLAI